MGEPLRKIDGGDFERNNEDAFDLDDLLHPAQAFSHPAVHAVAHSQKDH